MKKNTFLVNKGYTIIEVALVLAIAGLIFLMVFVALPSLRASQRDAQRRDDVMGFLTSAKKYQTNNRGALPISSNGAGEEIVQWQDGWGQNHPNRTTWAGFYYDYLTKDFVDPLGDHYTLAIAGCSQDNDSKGSCTKTGSIGAVYDNPFPNGYTMVVVLNAQCSDNVPIYSNNPRRLAVIYRLEGSGVYCNDM